MPDPAIPTREARILLLLVAVQFVPMVDAVLLMPLGPVLMHELGIGTAQHGLLVGGAAMAAALAGLVGVAILDRLPRRPALATVLAVFALAEIVCANAGSYAALLCGRFLAGASVGLCGALVLAVVGDVVPPERRGAATGKVMSAFAIASVVGVPIGAWAGVQGHWRWPFGALAILAGLACLLVCLRLPRLDGHLGRPRTGSPWSVLAEPRLLRCFGLSAGAAIAGYLVIPLISPYLVGNAGLPLALVPAIYAIGGSCAVFSTPWIGRMADRIGALPVFIAVSLIAIAPILAITHLPRLPAWAILLVTTAFIIFVSGRFTAHAALLGSLADPARRGAAFACNGAVISLSMGGAAILAGQLSRRQLDGSISGYGTLGLVSAGVTLGTLLLALGLKPRAGAGTTAG